MARPVAATAPALRTCLAFAVGSACIACALVGCAARSRPTGDNDRSRTSSASEAGSVAATTQPDAAADSDLGDRSVLPSEGDAAPATDDASGAAAPGDAAGPDRVAATPPPADDALALFHATKEDPPAEELGGVEAGLKGKHYVAGNERDIHVYYKHLRKLGGGYIGVGTDQAYVFLGWQEPEYAWLIDYDPYVMSVHDVYFAFFERAATPSEFLHLWTPAGKDEALELLRTRYEGARRQRATGVYGKYRGWIQRRLLQLHNRHREAEVPSFVWHEGTYARVRALVASGRVRPMLANLLERGAIERIGDAARSLGVTVRVLYLSNAEEYWSRYTSRYRSNIQALPFDERSVVVRTLLTWSENMDYRYNLQPSENYVLWLREDWVRNVYDVARRKRRPEGEARPELEFSKTALDPTEVPWNPNVKAAKKAG